MYKSSISGIDLLRMPGDENQ